MSKELTNLIVSRMIARKDAKAIQRFNGDGEVIYTPVRTGPKDAKVDVPWSREDFEAHLAGDKTFGHYLVNTDNECKIVCFDIDLRKEGYLPQVHDTANGVPPDNFVKVDDLRGAWHNRREVGRTFMKSQFRLAAHQLSRIVQENLGSEYDVCVAYSGNKGVHVYVLLPEARDAEMARQMGVMVMDASGCWVPNTESSEIFFRHDNQDPSEGMPNLSIEVFPKQGNVNGGGYGNLVRLPLGKNLKHTDPTFFIDMTAPLVDLKPLDPIRALTPGYNMWQTPEEAAAR